MRVFSKCLSFIFISLFTLTATSANNKIKTVNNNTGYKFVKAAGDFRTLEDTLTSNGFTHAQATELLKEPIVPVKWHLNPKDKFLVSKKAGRTEIHFFLDYSDDSLVFWKTDKDYGLEKKNDGVTTLNKVVEGPIIGSLSESIKKKVNDEWVVNRFTDAFVWDLDLEKTLKQKDHFKFVLEQKFIDGLLVKDGEILEAELTTGGQTYKRVLLQKDGQKAFIDPEKPFDERPFYCPVGYAHISSLFSRHRMHPIRHRYIAHEGIDYALPEGSAVYAAREGIVEDVAKRRGNGRYITILHPDGLISYYNHLLSAVESLRPGQHVSAGEVIGFVGCSGLCTSPHLHFAIKKGLSMINPIHLIKPFPFLIKDYRSTMEFKRLLALRYH